MTLTTRTAHAILAAILLLLLASEAWFYRAQEHIIRRQVEDDLAAITRLKVNQVSEWRRERLAEGAELMDRPGLSVRVARWLTSQDPADAAYLLTEFGVLQEYDGYSDVLLVDTIGQVRLSLSGTTAPHGLSVLPTALREGKPVLTDLHIEEYEPNPHLETVAPLFPDGDRSQSPLGALVLINDARRFLYPLIQSWPVHSETAETYILRREDDTALILNDLRYRAGTALQERVSLSARDQAAARAAQGYEGAMVGKDYRGVPVLSYSMPIPDSPWYLVAKMDTREAFATWRARSVPILVLLVSLAGLVATLAVVVWQRNMQEYYRRLYESEAAQRASEVRYRELFENTPIGLYRMTPDGRVLEANSALVQMLGYPDKESLLQVNAADIYLDSAERGRQVCSLQSEAGLQRYETQMRRYDGSVIWVRDTVRAVHDRDGRVCYFEGSMENISMRKATEEALAAERLLLRTLIDNLPVAVYIKDTACRKILANPTDVRFMGASSEADVLGKTDLDIFPPDVAGTLYADDAAVIRTGIPVLGREEAITYPDGTVRWLLTNKVPLRDSSGQVIGLVGIGYDITQRKQVEDAIRESNRRLAVLNQAGLALAETLDFEATCRTAYVYVSRLVDCPCFGVSLYDKSTNTLHAAYMLSDGERLDPTLFPPLTLPTERPLKGRARAVHEQQPEIVVDMPAGPSAEAVVVGHPGNHRMARTALYVPMVVRGQVVGLLEVQSYQENAYSEADIAILGPVANQIGLAIENTRLFSELQAERDVLAQRVAERTTELAAANRELEAFAYSVSHDLRAPLRALDGFSAMLLSRYGDQLDEEGKHYLARLREASQRMDRLISDLLHLSRVTRSELHRTRCDLSSMAREVAAELQTQAPQRSVQFLIADDLIADGDPGLLRIVLQNLLDNAWKFTGTREKACIEFGMAEQRGEQVFFVRDNGVGFDMAYADKLFAPFQRLHAEREFPGTGIGLATVQRVITRHGGRVWAEAKPDEGATFYFTLK